MRLTSVYRANSKTISFLSSLESKIQPFVWTPLIAHLFNVNFAQVDCAEIGDCGLLFAALGHREAAVECDQNEGDRQERNKRRDHHGGERFVGLTDLKVRQLQS